MGHNVHIYKSAKNEKKLLTNAAGYGMMFKSVEHDILKASDYHNDHESKWKLSSAGRASALHAEGHRFEPYSFHQPLRSSSSARYGLVVQLVRTPPCHGGGRGFESHPGRQCASVAQSVEQGTENPRVDGLIPSGSTKYADLAHLVERHLAKVEVASSSLVIRSTICRGNSLGILFYPEDHACTPLTVDMR